MHKIIYEILSQNAAENITTLDLRNKSNITDFYIISSFSSSRQVKAISKILIKKLKEAGAGKLEVCGIKEGNWTTIDCESTIIHIFRKEVREYYKIEELWNSYNPNN